jgi:hypothetical protein
LRPIVRVVVFVFLVVVEWCCCVQHQVAGYVAGCFLCFVCVLGFVLVVDGTQAVQASKKHLEGSCCIEPLLSIKALISLKFTCLITYVYKLLRI